MSNTHHYILSFTWINDRGLVRAWTIDGETSPNEGASRLAVYRELLAYAKAQCGVPAAEPVVTQFFSLEPMSFNPQSSSPAVSAPAGEAAHPGPSRHGDERGPGCVPSFPC